MLERRGDRVRANGHTNTVCREQYKDRGGRVHRWYREMAMGVQEDDFGGDGSALGAEGSDSVSDLQRRNRSARQASARLRISDSAGSRQTNKFFPR
eukprot:1236707-Rhodomonas_salina.1